jgi:hypothetical protein
MVGYADLPEWLDFNEKPPRSFEVIWIDQTGKPYMKSMATTNRVTPVTKEVADIIRSVRHAQ